MGMELRARCVTTAECLPRMYGALPFILNTLMRRWGQNLCMFQGICFRWSVGFPFTSSHPHPFEKKHHPGGDARGSQGIFQPCSHTDQRAKEKKPLVTSRLGTLLCKSCRRTWVVVSKRTCLNQMQEKVQPVNQENHPEGLCPRRHGHT